MRFLTIIMMLISTSAFADHYSWSGNRGGFYSNSYQFLTASEGLHSSVNDTTETKEYKGLGLRTGLGTELVRFVRFSGYHEYRDISNNATDSLRGSELGADCKVSFFGPILNLHLGVGLYSMRLLHQKDDQATIYFGSGSAGIFGFERFLSEKSSITFDARVAEENLKAEVGEAKLNNKMYGASLALLLWFN